MYVLEEGIQAEGGGGKKSMKQEEKTRGGE